MTSSEPHICSTEHRFADDAEMQSAASRARDSVRYLIRELFWEDRRIVTALDFCAVKAAFDDSPGHEKGPEFIWVTDVGFDGEYFIGTLCSQPHWVTCVQEDQPVKLPLSHILDWMFAINDRVFGGFTVDVLRSRMSDQDRAGHDEAWDLVFPEPGKVRLFDGSHYVKENGIQDHALALHMVDQIEELCREEPEAVSDPDDAGWTMLHAYAMGGSEMCVDALIRMGADRALQTREGFRPFDLAKKLGWKDIAGRLQSVSE